MAQGFTMKIEGARELQARLKGLPDRVSKRYMGKALKAGMQPVLDDAKANCPVYSGPDKKGVERGAGRNSLHITVTQRSGETTATVSNERDQYYLLMQEQGWTPGRRLREQSGGRRVTTGHYGNHESIPGKHFMLNALERRGPQAIEIAAAELKRQLDKNESVAARAARKE